MARYDAEETSDDEDEAPIEMPPIVYTPRACLRCGGAFPSSGPGNRICSRCAKNHPQISRRELDGALRPVWDRGVDNTYD